MYNIIELKSKIYGFVSALELYDYVNVNNVIDYVIIEDDDTHKKAKLNASEFKKLLYTKFNSLNGVKYYKGERCFLILVLNAVDRELAECITYRGVAYRGINMPLDYKFTTVFRNINVKHRGLLLNIGDADKAYTIMRLLCNLSNCKYKLLSDNEVYFYKIPVYINGNNIFIHSCHNFENEIVYKFVISDGDRVRKLIAKSSILVPNDNLEVL